MSKERNSELGYPVKSYSEPVKRYCQILEITDDPEMIRLYRECHSQEKAWKEIRDGIRSVGILEMELYIFGNKVVMIVETPLDFKWESAMAKLAGLPRQAEWEAFVAKFQGCDANATSDQKWQLMDRMFYLYED
ncbi:MAG: L-rhamnose mutarotase [Muribaculaceae bacterium]|nr:L-rhamnose mutarotase [Muribaculaceae bacterium]